MADKTTSRRCSLVLAAHGSMAAENSNQPLRALAELIAADPSQNFDVITPAFLMGHPLMTNVLDQLPAGDVVIVPVMTSDGYYLRKLPAMYAQNQTAEKFQCWMTPVVGMHDSIPAMLARNAQKLIGQHNLSPEETTIVVVGHGTRRNQTSGQSTYTLTDSLKEVLSPTNEGLQFETGFLDQDPELTLVATNIKTRHTLILPFLISRGPHTTEDVPQAFGLPEGPDIEFPLIHSNTQTGGKIVYASPLGMFPEIANICLELANQTLLNDQPIELLIENSSATGELAT